MSPKHIDRITDPQRIAIAPYNFVELPEKVVTVSPESLPQENRYYSQSENRYTGKIECTLTTESPLYIRCGLTIEEFRREKESKDLPDFFYTNSSEKDIKPVIPGSSLRGMIRNLVEIASFSKVDRVSDEQRLFFRAVAANPKEESWGKEYKKYVEPKKIQAGYLKKDNQGWYIQPAKTEQGATFAWVKETTLNLPNFKNFNDDKYKPQYIDVSYRSVAEEPTDRAKRLFANNVELPDTHAKKGVLVTSGNMKQSDDKPSPRRNHCLVFEPISNATNVRINKIAIDHYLNALTDFQKKPPFGKDSGIFIEENRPIFYLPPENSNTVAFFGQSPNFRIPYSPEGNGHVTTVINFIPKDLRQLASIDIADAIFGWVKQESEEELPKDFDRQRVGRVFITNAITQQNDVWYTGNSNDTITPQILASPKPSCFPHYLVQPNTDKSELKHFASEPITETVIRGHKLYWHKGSNPDLKLPPQKKVIGSPKKVSDTQTTQIKPIKAGISFKFNIHFENLSNLELGALIWVLDIAQDDRYRLKLGMGKPLGMGAVKIDYELHLSDRLFRYSKLFNNNQWTIGEKIAEDKDCKTFVEAFEKHILNNISENDHPEGRTATCLTEVPRIEMLLAMLSWEDNPSSKYLEQRQYMELKCFTDRKVLPTPLQVVGWEDNQRFNNSSSPSNSPENNSNRVLKPQLKNSEKTKPIKKGQQSQQQPKDNSGGSNFAARARPSKPKS